MLEVTFAGASVGADGAPLHTLEPTLTITSFDGELSPLGSIARTRV
jgi:hypothetical protein